ncbi:hypothetical protein [Rhodovulum steppense]|uniref:Uncharacterized protein n=1 Tax=Rhodovulum steppense TaxID=540251 RepID=A0A4R1YLP4_9RHOB|nr:hypothetical protein [Rhodovulum steppense]TCM78349.1 hypothetical protein EV216_12626 [Rhodovulum steppense]
MTTTFPALTSLFAAAGALALVGRAAWRWRGTRDVALPAAHASSPPMPRELPVAPAPARRHRAELPDTTCDACGTMIPGGERICPICARKQAAAKGAGWTTLWHWLFTIAVLTVLYGGAYLLAP